MEVYVRLHLNIRNIFTDDDLQLQDLLLDHTAHVHRLCAINAHSSNLSMIVSITPPLIIYGVIL